MPEPINIQLKIYEPEKTNFKNAQKEAIYHKGTHLIYYKGYAEWCIRAMNSLIINKKITWDDVDE